MTQSLLGFGIAGALDLAIVRSIAPRLEAAGFATLWVNDTPDGDSLRSLAAAAEVTTSLRLATGVISVDRRPAEEIISAVHHLALPQSRLIVGIGSSAPPSPLTRIESSIDALHGGLSSRVMVGALGPRMRKVAVTRADGALLNWLTPAAARSAAADMEETLAGSGGRPGYMALYVRTALGAAAGTRLKAEAERYEQIPSYAANFRRFGVQAIDTAIRADTPARIREGVARYDGTLDEIVIRAITANDAIDEYLELMEAVMGDRSHP